MDHVETELILLTLLCAFICGVALASDHLFATALFTALTGAIVVVIVMRRSRGPIYICLVP